MQARASSALPTCTPPCAGTGPTRAGSYNPGNVGGASNPGGHVILASSVELSCEPKACLDCYPPSQAPAKGKRSLSLCVTDPGKGLVPLCEVRVGFSTDNLASRVLRGHQRGRVPALPADTPPGLSPPPPPESGPWRLCQGRPPASQRWELRTECEHSEAGTWSSPSPALSCSVAWMFPGRCQHMVDLKAPGNSSWKVFASFLAAIWREVRQTRGDFRGPRPARGPG